jgi:hypothetical protein
VGRLVRIGAKIVRHGRSVIFQLAQAMVSRGLIAALLVWIAWLRVPAAPALRENFSRPVRRKTAEDLLPIVAQRVLGSTTKSAIGVTGRGFT